MNPPTGIGVALTLACGLCGQGPTSTSPAGPPPGRTNNSLPFGSAQVAHQQVHSASSFSSASPMVINSLSFDISVSSTTAAIDVELFMADAPHNADAISSVFANNIVPGTEVNVFRRRQVNLPPWNGAWSFAFPLDTPYSWNGGHLTWRTNVHGNNQGNQTQRFAVVAYRDAGSSISRTNGCQSALGTAAADHYAMVPTLGGQLGLFADSYVAGGGLPAILSVGLSKTQLGSVALPLDLGILGAPGCLVTNDFAALIPTTTRADPTGSVALSFPTPNQQALAGVPFYTQYVFLQAGANALGVFTTNGTENVIGYDPGVSRVYGAIGGTGGTAASTQKQFGLAIALN